MNEVEKMKKAMWIGVSVLSICFVCSGCFGAKNLDKPASKMDNLTNKMNEIAESTVTVIP